ncbi:hypothetical protein FM103_18640 [Corynebacterium xerosis]|nr:hypothetical protein FM103_18640 [Corynebacterium xerosis]
MLLGEGVGCSGRRLPEEAPAPTATHVPCDASLSAPVGCIVDRSRASTTYRSPDRELDLW